MAIVTYFHILAELLTILEESFESKELLPKSGHKAILPSIYFRKKLTYVRLRTQVTSLYLFYVIIVFNTHLPICLRRSENDKGTNSDRCCI